MRMVFNDHIVEMTFSMIEIGLFVIGCFLVVFFGVLTAVIASRGII